MNAVTRTRATASKAVSIPQPTLVEPILADSLLNFVARAMADPSIDVGKLEMLLRMQREIVADDARLQFNRAMSTAQGEMQPVVRDATNDQTKSRYARLETIDATIRPIYVRHGFCLTFNSEPVEGPNERITCEVAHAGGHTKKYQLDAAADTAGPQGKANKTALHGLGSTVSYLRRYLTVMIFNIALVNEDNDGNKLRPPAEPAGRDQVAELRALIAACSADPSAAATNEQVFLAKMGFAGLRLQDAPPRELPRLRTALLAKAAVVATRATSKTNGAAA